MAKSKWTGLYNAIKNIRAPRWLRDFLGILQEIVIAILLQVGKEYLRAIEGKIIEVAQLDISGEEKFRKVFSWVRAELKLEKMKDSALNFLLEALVNKLKKDKII